MFNSLGESLSSWWGGKGEEGEEEKRRDKEVEKKEKEGDGVEREGDDSKKGTTDDGAGWNKGLEVATGLFQSVTGYATTISENVKKQVIDTTNSSFIGDFHREQEKFARTQQRLKDASVPPWVGYNEEEQLKAQIIEISSDSRNVLREPPPEVDFPFEYSRIAPVAMVMLKEDPRLQKLRFELVPKKVAENIFWRNYFYRVSLAKQSVQLSSLASVNSQTSIESREQPQAEGVESKEDDEGEESVDASKVTSEVDEPVDEFISDHPYNVDTEMATVNKETLKRELSQLGVESSLGEGGGGGGGIDEGELWDELQAELKDLDLEDETEDGLLVDWEQEMNDMMKSDTQNEQQQQ